MGDLAHGRHDQAEETGRFRHRIAGDMPDAQRLFESELLQDQASHGGPLVAEGCQGPDRATELADCGPSAHVADPFEMAANPGQPPRALEPEGEGKSVTAERPRHHQCLAMRLRDPDEDRGEGLEVGFDRLQGPAHLKSEGRIHDVLGRAAPVDVLTVVAIAGGNELANQRRDRVAGTDRVRPQPP